MTKMGGYCRFCGCVPGHRMLVLTSACANCGLTEIEVEEGEIRACVPLAPPPNLGEERGPTQGDRQ